MSEHISEDTVVSALQGDSQAIRQVALQRGIGENTVRAALMGDAQAIRQLSCAQHLVVILDANAKALGPGGQDTYQIRPVEIIKISISVIYDSLTVYINALPAPAE